MYSEDQINGLYNQLDENTISYRNMYFELLATQNIYQSEKAQEYLLHGVMRRLNILSRAVENIFTLLPPTQKTQLDIETRNDVEINLHAFLININGLIDNLAWCYAHESKTDFKNHDVGLFKKKTQNILGPSLKDLIQSEPINNWYKKYSKDFRDALAHRIPMYVPPTVLDDREAEEHRSIELEKNSLSIASTDYCQKMKELMERQDKLGNPSFLFTHSFGENSKVIWIHHQLLSDMATVMDVFKAHLKDCTRAMREISPT